jgi:hypothetical protein
MSTEKQRLILYDGIRRMHSELALLIMCSASVLEQNEWLQNTMDTLSGVMYLAESAILEDKEEKVSQ